MLSIKIGSRPINEAPSQPLEWTHLAARLAEVQFPEHPALEGAVHNLEQGIDRGLSAELGIPCIDGAKREVEAPLVCESKGAALMIANERASGETLAVFKVFLTEAAVRVMAWAAHQPPSSASDTGNAFSVKGEDTTMSVVPVLTVPYREIAFHVKNDGFIIDRALGPHLELLVQRLRESAELELFARTLKIDTSDMQKLVASPYVVELSFSTEWRSVLGSPLARPQLILKARVAVPDGHEFDSAVLKSSDGEPWSSSWHELATFRYEQGRVVCLGADEGDVCVAPISTTLAGLGAVKSFSEYVGSVGVSANVAQRPVIKKGAGLLSAARG